MEDALAAANGRLLYVCRSRLSLSWFVDLLLVVFVFVKRVAALKASESEQ